MARGVHFRSFRARLVSGRRSGDAPKAGIVTDADLERAKKLVADSWHKQAMIDAGQNPAIGHGVFTDPPKENERTCPRCDGRGIDPFEGFDAYNAPKCFRCNGKGSVVQ